MSKQTKIAYKKIECRHCNKNFVTDEAFVRHLKTHDDSQLMCLTCNKSFSRKSNLTRHNRQFHKNLIDIPVFECDECDESFEYRFQLIEHQVIHEQNDDFDEKITKIKNSDLVESGNNKKDNFAECTKTYTNGKTRSHNETSQIVNLECYCSICNKSFSRKPNLNRHNRQFHPAEALPPKCDQYGKSVEVTINISDQDKADLADRKQSLKSESDDSDVCFEDKVISKKFECKNCDKSFTSYRALSFHRKIHVDDFNGKLHFCSICNKSFSVKSNMTRHMRHVHSNVVEEPLFQCGRCDKSFPDKDLLSEHKKSHDVNKVDLFKCSQCPKKFAYRKYVKRHERMVHTNEKPIICEYCGKSFSYYRKHKSCIAYSETSSESYECDTCLKIFTSKAGLLYHKFRCPKLQPDDNTNNNSQQENFKLRHKCSFCDKCFSGPKKREDHENIHTGERPYECEICTKTYKNATYLSIHKKRHAAEKKFKCSYCAKSFIYLRLLKIHERIHTDERPFKCKYCEKSFTRKHILFGHEILHLLKDKSKDVKYIISDDHIVLDSFQELNEQYQENCNEAIKNNEDLTNDKIDTCVENESLLSEENILNQSLQNFNKIEKTEILFLQSDEDEYSFFENINDIDTNDDLVVSKHETSSIKNDKQNVTKFEIVYLKNNEIEKNEDDSNEVLSTDDGEIYISETNSKFNKEKKITVNSPCNLLVNNNNEKLTEQLNSESKVKSFICSYCGKQYTKMLFLKIHEGKHTGDAPFKCEICNKDFVTKTHLSRHTSIHKNANKYICQLCNKAFNRKLSLQIHERTHTGEMPFKCDKCEKCFRSIVSLREHQKDFCKFNRRSTSFQCNTCTKTFHSIKTRNSHQNRVHKKAYERPTCETCGKTYSCRQAYRNHRPCMKNPEKSTETVECNYCSKVFTTKEGLKYHIRICFKEPQTEIKVNYEENDDKRRHKCSFCGKGFTGPKKREDHERIHTGERPFKCDICSKSYKDAKYLTSHKKRHAFKKSFKCSYCSRSFIFEKLRIIHERVHTGERPFQCKHCDKSYTTKYALYSHESIHILNDEEATE